MKINLSKDGFLIRFWTQNLINFFSLLIILIMNILFLNRTMLCKTLLEHLYIKLINQILITFYVKYFLCKI